MESHINPQYLKKESIEQIQNAWKKEEHLRHILLTNFFTKEYYTIKEKELKTLAYRREHQPDAYSHTKAKATSLHILDNKSFLKYLSTILDKDIRNCLGEAQYFSWKDYTLLKKKQTKGIEIVIDFTEDWEEQWGGATIYKDPNGRYLKILPNKNSLLIIEKKNIQGYIQYINNLAKGKKRYFLIANIK